MSALVKTTNEVLADIVEEMELAFMRRDTNRDGRDYCEQCGATKPRRGKARHDGTCPIGMVQSRIGRFSRPRSHPAKETKP